MIAIVCMSLVMMQRMNADEPQTYPKMEPSCTPRTRPNAAARSKLSCRRTRRHIFGTFIFGKNTIPWWLARARKPFTHLLQRLCGPTRLRANLPTRTGDTSRHRVRPVQPMSKNMTMVWICTVYPAAARTTWILIYLGRAHILKDLETEQYQCCASLIMHLLVLQAIWIRRAVNSLTCPTKRAKKRLFVLMQMLRLLAGFRVSS